MVGTEKQQRHFSVREIIIVRDDVSFITDEYDSVMGTTYTWREKMVVGEGKMELIPSTANNYSQSALNNRFKYDFNNSLCATKYLELLRLNFSKLPLKMQMDLARVLIV